MTARELADEKLRNLLNDRDGQLYELALRLDVLDAQIRDELHIQHMQTKQRLERLGYNVTGFAPPPRPHWSEQRTSRHVGSNDDIEALITSAKGSTLDDVWREHVASRSTAVPEPTVIRRYGCGTVTGVR
jgi:hypothetical protein